MDSGSKCKDLKSIAEENSNATYECARLNAVLTGKKIVKIIDKLEVIQSKEAAYQFQAKRAK